MAVKVSVVVLACAVVALAVLAPATAKPAAAKCLVGDLLDDVAERADAVIVGIASSEQFVEADSASSLFQAARYEVTVRVAAVLKGNSEADIVLSPPGSFMCGHPQLSIGERVLLFLRRPSGTVLGQYLLADGNVTSAYYGAIPAEDALRRVATITGATDEQLDAALAFAGVGPAPPPDAAPLPTDAPQPDAAPLPVDVEEDGGQPTLLIALASALLALLVAALAGLGLRRAR